MEADRIMEVGYLENGDKNSSVRPFFRQQKWIFELTSNKLPISIVNKGGYLVCSNLN